MLYDRIIIMANNIDSIISRGTSLFIGIGAAHLPKEKGVIVLLRNKGYTESYISSSNYFFDEQNNLHIKTIYKSTVSEEKISFLSTHVRSRFSTIRNLENNSVIQTSHTSEIRNLASLKD